MSISFANDINIHVGGAHETGFRAALTKVANESAKKCNYLKPNEENLAGEDIQEGLVAIIRAKLPEPQFGGQTETKPGNSIMRTMAEGVVARGPDSRIRRNFFGTETDPAVLSSRCQPASSFFRHIFGSL